MLLPALTTVLAGRFHFLPTPLASRRRSPASSRNEFRTSSRTMTMSRISGKIQRAVAPCLQILEAVQNQIGGLLPAAATNVLCQGLLPGTEFGNAGRAHLTVVEHGISWTAGFGAKARAVGGM